MYFSHADELLSLSPASRRQPPHLLASLSALLRGRSAGSYWLSLPYFIDDISY